MKKTLKKKLASLLVGVTLTMAAGMASAYPVDLDYLGTSNPVTISANFGFYNGGVYAGYELLSINGSGAINSFCIDPAFSPTNTTQYDIRPITEGSVYENAAYLFSLSNSSNASAVQIAIWETVLGPLGKFTWNNPDPTLHASVEDLEAQLLSLPSNFDVGNYSLAISPISGAPSDGQFAQDFIINTPVPEPATMLLLGLGLVGLAGVRRKFKH